MQTIDQDLKSLFVEIPDTSNPDMLEKINCILILYSNELVKRLHLNNISDYFSNLHIMSYNIKSIRNPNVNERIKRDTFIKTREMLIRDLYSLIAHQN